MDITYLGHSAFRLRSKEAVVITDPFNRDAVGFSMPQVSADVVTVSHQHEDHNAISQVLGTSRRNVPYIVTAPGEYEASGVGVFGWMSYHDSVMGAERGRNTVYSIVIDGVRVVHLGDVGHVLTDDIIQGLGAVDVLLLPVGGVTSIEPKDGLTIIEQLSPSIVIPMHYLTPDHDQNIWGSKKSVDEFLHMMGISDLEAVDKLKVSAESLPEQTTTVLMSRS